MSNDKHTIKFSGMFVWPSIAAMVIAMMVMGYSCNGCFDCTAPTRAPVPSVAPTPPATSHIPTPDQVGMVAT